MYFGNLRAIQASVFVHSIKCVPCLRKLCEQELLFLLVLKLDLLLVELD